MIGGNALKYEQSEKTAIANALTSKGVPTSTTASWGQIEQNIRKIKELNLSKIIEGIINKEPDNVKIPAENFTFLGSNGYTDGHYGLRYYRYTIKDLKKNDILFIRRNSVTNEVRFFIVTRIESPYNFHNDAFFINLETNTTSGETKDYPRLRLVKYNAHDSTMNSRVYFIPRDMDVVIYVYVEYNSEQLYNYSYDVLRAANYML